MSKGLTCEVYEFFGVGVRDGGGNQRISLHIEELRSNEFVFGTEENRGNSIHLFDSGHSDGRRFAFEDATEFVRFMN